MSDLNVTTEGHVAVLTVMRAPHNYFDQEIIGLIGDAAAQVDADKNLRAIVLASDGKNFCAGANFGDGSSLGEDRAASSQRLYRAAAELFRIKTPIVAAVQGAAVGGGLGLACMADFRVASPATRLHANFAKLGFHQGFGLSVTLPRIVGEQKAAEMLLLARAVKGEEGQQIGLVDRLVEDGAVLDGALTLANELASCAPLAVRSIRETLRGGLADQVQAVLERELSEQTWLWGTKDSKEGIAANLERRDPVYTAE